MKKYLFVLMSVAAFACNKEEKPADGGATDERAFKLKEVVAQGLPSPYFHYTYDDKNFVTKLQHASGLLQYHLQYHNGRLARMINNTIVNKDTLVYHYSENQVVRVDLITPEAGKIMQAELSYEGKQLREISWKKRNPDFSSSLVRRLVFSYRADGNLSTYEDFRNTGQGLELLKTHYFEAYDTSPNVEANYLIKDVFEHFLFLPQVQLHRNNPLREKVIGKQNDWMVQYEYSYSQNLPILKTAQLTQTRGVGVGSGPVTSTTTYSYY